MPPAEIPGASAANSAQSGPEPLAAGCQAPLSLSRLPGYLHASDVQGLAQLATQATLGVAGLAENVHGNVHQAVASFFGPPGAAFVDKAPDRSGVNPLGITDLRHGNVLQADWQGAGRFDSAADARTLLPLPPPLCRTVQAGWRQSGKP